MTGGKLAKRRGLYTSEDRLMTGGKLAKRRGLYTSEDYTAHTGRSFHCKHDRMTSLNGVALNGLTERPDPSNCTLTRGWLKIPGEKSRNQEYRKIS